MALDPNIAMNFRLPQAETPFQTMGGMLTLRNEMMKQEEAQRQIQKRQAFEREIQSLPEDQRTQENLVKIASKYADPDKQFQYGQQSLDRQAARAQAQQLALSREQNMYLHRKQQIEIAARNAATGEQNAATRQYLAQLSAANAALDKEWREFQARATAGKFEDETTKSLRGMGNVEIPQFQPQLLQQASPQAVSQAPVGTPGGIPGGRGGVVAQVPDEASGLAMAQGMMGQGRPFTLGVGHLPESIITQGAAQAPVAAPAPAPRPGPTQIGQFWSPDEGESDVPPSVLPRPGQGVPGVRAQAEAAATSGFRLSDKDLREIERKRRENADGAMKPPSGYRWKADGKLEPIPGGPGEKDEAQKLQNLGTALERANITEANAVIRAVEGALQNAPVIAEYISGPKSMLPDWAVPQNVREGRQAFQKLFNVTLKDRSGAAVTNQELERLKKEFATGAWKRPEQIIAGVNQARNIINEHYRGIISGFDPDTVRRYNDNLRSSGGKPILDSQGGAYADQEKERRYQEWKRRQGG